MSGQAMLSEIQSHASLLKSFGVARIGIFGSAARDEANETSDVDVLVEFIEGEKTFRNFMNTATLLENTFKKRVDLLTPDSISPYIKKYIERDIRYVEI